MVIVGPAVDKHQGDVAGAFLHVLDGDGGHGGTTGERRGRGARGGQWVAGGAGGIKGWINRWLAPRGLEKHKHGCSGTRLFSVPLVNAGAVA